MFPTVILEISEGYCEIKKTNAPAECNRRVVTLIAAEWKKSNSDDGKKLASSVKKKKKMFGLRGFFLFCFVCFCLFAVFPINENDEELRNLVITRLRKRPVLCGSVLAAVKKNFLISFTRKHKELNVVCFFWFGYTKILAQAGYDAKGAICAENVVLAAGSSPALGAKEQAEW